MNQSEIVAVRAPHGTFRYWLASLVIDLPSIGGFGGGEEPESARVVLRSRNKEIVILRTGTYRQANRAAERFKAELVKTGLEAFAAKYRIPTQDL